VGIRDLLSRGLRPIAKIIEICDASTADERERYWIDTLPNLFNLPNDPPAMGGHNKLALPTEVEERLGKLPDYQLAAIIGCCKTVIARRRREKGIPSYAETTGNDGKIKKGNYPKRWLSQ